MNYIFAIVPPILVGVLWDKITPHLQRVVDASAGEISLESIKQRALEGNTTFVLVLKDDFVVAVNTVEVEIYQSGLKALHIPVVGGNEAFIWGPKFLEFAEEIAKSLGCIEMRGFSTRESWKRVLKGYGWEESHFVIKKKVGE